MTDPIISSLQNYCSTLSGCLQALYNLIVAFAVVLAFIMFFIGAFKNLLSSIPDIKMEGKKQMRNSLIGLAVIFASGVLFYWINPEIFNAKLIIYRVEFSYTKVFVFGLQEINRLISTGKATPLKLEGRGERCEQFLKAIDELVDNGVGAGRLYDLTKYQLDGKNLTTHEVKVLLKALLITETGGHGCDPRTYGRGDYAFATFGIEYSKGGKENEVSTRSKNRESRNRAYALLIQNDIIPVYNQLPSEIKNKINISPSDFNINELRVGGKLDNPYLISAVAIKRLSRYEEHLNKMGLNAYSRDLGAVLLRYKVGQKETIQQYIETQQMTHQDVANILATIKKERGTT